MEFAKLKILLLGCTGMLGGAFVRSFAANSSFEVIAPLRGSLPEFFKKHSSINFLTNVDFSEDEIHDLLSRCQPDIVLNCIGYIKQRSLLKTDTMEMLKLNGLLPHIISRWTSGEESKLITFSTDCIFNGELGKYTEADQPTPCDFYGVSKLAGEVDDGKSLTLRTSIVGPEYRNKLSLLEWFIATQGPAKGYVNAIYSGLPTRYLADFILNHMAQLRHLSGTYHISSSPISKYELLRKFNEKLDLGKNLSKDDTVKIDRSLDSGKLQRILNIEIPDWDQLMHILEGDFHEVQK